MIRSRAGFGRLLALVIWIGIAAGIAGCGRAGGAVDSAPIAAAEPLIEIPSFDDRTIEQVLLPPLGSPLPQPWAPGPALKPAAAPPPSIAGIAAVVLDEASGEVLYDKSAHMAAAPASLTKIATLILALEDGRLDEWVDIDVDSTAMRGSSVMGLLPGDRFTLRDLLYGLMLPSGNDAALSIGRFVAGTDESFVFRMNVLLRRLGLTESSFANPHGLGRENHYASAYDLAMLSRYGMSIPGFLEIVSAGYWSAEGSRTIPLGNINAFLTQYRGADGLKTGYTRRAGPTLAASATRNGVRLYAIVLNSPSREHDARLLLDWAFASYSFER